MKKEETKEQQEAQQSAAAVSVGSPAEITTPVILRAKSREELDTQFAELKAKHDGHTLTAGAVARSKDDGTYLIRIDII